MKKKNFINKVDNLAIFGLFSTIIYLAIRGSMEEPKHPAVKVEPQKKPAVKVSVAKSTFKQDLMDFAKNHPELDDFKWYNMSDAIKAVYESSLTDYYKNQVITNINNVDPKKTSSDFWKSIVYIVESDSTDYYIDKAVQNLCNSRC